MWIKDLIGETSEYDKKERLEIRKPKSWLKSVSAFANGVGGVLIFGISDDNQITGVENAQGLMEIISEQLKTRLDPIPEIILKAQAIDGKEILTLEVQPGEETPYYYVGEGSHTAFIRIGNESVTAGSNDLKRLVLRGKNRTYDSLITDYKIDDYSFSKLKAVYYKVTHKSMETKEFESFGIVDKNGFLTNAGALLADESPVYCSRLFCTRWNGLDKASGIIEATDDAEYTGSLIFLLEEGINFVKRNSRKMWKKGENGRIDYPDYPERSIFECIVNALVHRDYLDLGSEVHIDIFDDRIEIYSPGGMYDGSFIQNRDIENVPSKRRNPVVADIFNRLDYMERRGSGFKKIIKSYKAQKNFNNNKEPIFYSNQTEFIVTLKNLNYKNENIEVLNEVLNEVLDEVLENQISNLNTIEKLIIQQIIRNPRITQKEIAVILNLSLSTIQRVIKQLVGKGMISRVNGKRNGFWQLNIEVNGF